MNLSELWESIVVFFADNVLYACIGGAALLLLVIVLVAASSRAKNRKRKASPETNVQTGSSGPVVPAQVPAPAVPQASVKTAPRFETEQDPLKAPVAAEKPCAAVGPVAKKEENPKVAIMTPAKEPAKRMKETLPPSEPPAPEPAQIESEKLADALKRPGVIQIYKDNGNRFRFKVKAANGFVIGHSQGYANKYSCKGGIDAVISIADAETVDATKSDYKAVIGRPAYEIYRDNENKFRFRLRAANAVNLLASQGYTTKENCYKGIKSLKHIVLNHTISEA
jgi:uncharacterized protein YegP (UPF0339 family)